MSHLTPVSLLVGVFAALIVFTIVTVLVTRVDLGGEGNFVIAMIIATIKASLVMAYFMHLRWDKRLNLIVFLSSFLFVTLFLGLALTDRKEYQDVIDSFEETQALQAGG
jgi:cytochrome c oxidase subunit 4